MSQLPLLAGDPAAPLIQTGGQILSRAQFLGRAAAFARQLPENAALLNLCESRYSFMLAFCAILLKRGVNQLPPSAAPEVLREIATRASARCVLAEREDLTAGLPWLRVPAADETAEVAGFENPMLDTGQVVAVAYTSGSTGTPTAHRKTWGALVRTAQLANARFLPGLPQASVLGTVPAQHMYGLETTVMFALAGNACATDARPFFPADIASTLASAPGPRVLITTPVHLRACISAGIRLPALAKIISATAPLPRDLALAAEEISGAEVHEIYGCTEAGSMATRRTVVEERWQLYPGMRIRETADGAEVENEHLGETIRVQDRVDIEPDGRFRLLGRSGDLVKVAGKRISLADLTARLLSVPGVEDAAVIPPDEGGLAQRVAALVVAPQLSEAQVLDALAALVDPVFLPRPLRKVERLPRNAVGKLPVARLRELIAHD